VNSSFMVHWNRTSTAWAPLAQFRCVWPQNVESTTHGFSITRKIALCIQAPAQESRRTCSSTRQCWLLKLWMLCIVARRCCDCCEFGADYKYPDSSPLEPKCAPPKKPNSLQKYYLDKPRISRYFRFIPKECENTIGKERRINLRCFACALRCCR